ncbi:hypothetical protein PFICI_01721 [Pestalotiopsis fici W106-1]|uniref:Major facilitator superfamily (MFS) profile domain-containing protein n=1 Tax=Pestalotiopsis fici (strain W106-1 / CGMCC3.15140) TaxID=1229662 RepID=W3XPA9_PESFW|nr:uncharacterized protein PFICI_01721 [Pestalotiopsis fici W106-1]ETS87893.1 hypothetical protein PFICI_01721 [Pestalotiopsis fici W106-1]
MATFFRDTAFGQVVRLLSHRRLLRYPDEIDPLLWKKSLQQHGAAGCSISDPGVESNSAQILSDNEEKSPIRDPRRQMGLIENGAGPAQAVEDGRDVYLVGWYGPDDPEDPLNWPESWKFIIAFQVCILNFVVYIASSLYVPGETSFMEEFDVSETVATLGLSLFSVGYGFGPMLWSPMSEMPSLGRSPIYVWTLLIFVLLELPVGFAVNPTMFLVFRTLSGFVGSPTLATGGATIADVYGPARAAFGICIWASFGVCGPVFGPLIGGFVAPVKGWRWTIWSFTWMCSICWLCLFFLLPETSSANILYRRAKRLRRATGQNQLRSQSEIDSAHHTMKDHAIVLGRAFALTFTEPIAFLVDLYTALLYGVLFIWFESFPLVFGGLYGFSTQMLGLVYLGIFVGGVITVPCYLLWVKRILIPSSMKSTFRPEHVLPPTWFGAISLPVCLFWHGWTAKEDIHWMVPIVGSSFFTVALVTFFNGILNYLGMSYPVYAASVFAGNGLFRALSGAVFPLFVCTSELSQLVMVC